jgi:hypothetical protein
VGLILLVAGCKVSAPSRPDAAAAAPAARADAAAPPPDAGAVHCPRSTAGSLCFYFEPDLRYRDSRDGGVPSSVTVAFLCDQESWICRVLINDKEVATEDQIRVESFASLLHVTGDDDRLFLLHVYSGDGCPVVYRLLHVRPDASFTLTDHFGNCEDAETPVISAERVRFTFPAWPQGKRPKMQYTYSISAHALDKLPAHRPGRASRRRRD